MTSPFDPYVVGYWDGEDFRLKDFPGVYIEISTDVYWLMRRAWAGPTLVDHKWATLICALSRPPEGKKFWVHVRHLAVEIYIVTRPDGKQNEVQLCYEGMSAMFTHPIATRHEGFWVKLLRGKKRRKVKSVDRVEGCDSPSEV